MSNITDILHAIPADPLTGSITVPVYQTSTFVQESPGVNKGYDYARTGNPTRHALETLVNKMEYGHQAFAFATGLAAIDAVLKLLSAGDEIIAVDDIYGGAFRLFNKVYAKLGIKVHYVDTSDPIQIISMLSDKTRLIWIETPTNPTLKISDIKSIANIAKRTDALLVVDNTFASPISQNPLLLGADIVVHSATKYLGGHSDLVAGIVVAKDREIVEQIKFIQNASGGVLSPWDCFLVIRGIETIELRVHRQSANALEIAKYLQTRPEVSAVYYPGLEDHKNHLIARDQQNGIFGGVVSFSLTEDTSENAIRFVENTKYFKLAESLGGVKSLVSVPSLMTHASIPRDRRLRAGITDSLIRLSCGIEDVNDLKKDIRNALQFVNKSTKTESVFSRA